MKHVYVGSIKDVVLGVGQVLGLFIMPNRLVRRWTR